MATEGKKSSAPQKNKKAAPGKKRPANKGDKKAAARKKSTAQEKVAAPKEERPVDETGSVRDDAESRSEEEAPRADSAEPKGAETIVDGVTDVISATFEVGASLARAFARATAGDREVEEPSSARPFDGIVHYSVASVTNVVRLVGDSVSAAIGGDDDREHEPDRPAETARDPAAPGSDTTAGGLPRVARGGTLRIPLSVENPGPEPMRGMAVTLGAVSVENVSPGRALGPEALRFEPATLNVAPRDFEKLTVFVDTEPDTAIGLYTADVHIGTDAHTARLVFAIVEASER